MGRSLKENAEPADLMDKLLGQCLEKSGFDKNCVKDENGVKFFDVSLAVTTIEKSQFVRAER